MNAMKIISRIGVALVLDAGLRLSPLSSAIPDLGPEAQAIVGVPASPVSVAGVARRSCYRRQRPSSRRRRPRRRQLRSYRLGRS
jgi:hypothetical protein